MEKIKTIAIITAMESEFNAIHKQYDFVDDQAKSYVRVYDKNIFLIKSGIGKVNAALTTEHACQLGADLVITTGLAGGIDSSLTQGDTVLATEVCYHDVWCGEPNAYGQIQDMPLYYKTPSNIVQNIIASAPKGYFHIGLTVTGDQFVTDATRLNEIKATFPNALAVDMESAAVAQTCLLNKKAFMSLRIISDVVGKTTQMEQYDAFWQNVPNKASEMVDTVLRSL